MKWLGLVMIASSCASARPLDTRVLIAEGASFELLAPASFGRSLALEQIVEATHDGHVTSMRCALEIEPDELRLVAFTPFGTAAFTVAFDGRQLHIDERLPGQLPADPRHVLADLQLSLWPALPPIEGFEIVETKPANGSASGRVRELRRAGRTLIRISTSSELPWRSRLTFEHLERGYSLVVDTLSEAEIAP